MGPHRFTVDGVPVEVSLPPPADRPSAFVFGLSKAGSSLLNNVVNEIAKSAGLPVIDIPTACFQAGARTYMAQAGDFRPILEKNGYLFAGFRSLKGVPAEVLGNRRKVLLVRDPRDMLVSRYFSVRYSHVLPGPGPGRDTMVRLRNSLTGVDAYAVSEDFRRITGEFRAYMKAIDPTWRVYRYEDIIFEKRAWVRDLAAYLDAGADTDAIADRHDILPEAEDGNAHIRQVRPGNHRVHLASATIARLDDEFSDILTRFGYERSSRSPACVTPRPA